MFDLGTALLIVAFIYLDEIWSVLSYVYTGISQPKALVERFGPWALVTGATDGLGRCLADELARLGFSLVLVSRNEEKLAKTAKEISISHDVEVRLIAADFTDSMAAVAKVRAELGDTPISLLINNVGLLSAQPEPFTKQTDQFIMSLVNVNIGAATLMTHLLLPKMVARKCGCIVNIGSGSEFGPLPYFTVYSATKVYLRTLTNSLRAEYGRKNISFMYCTPFVFHSNMSKTYADFPASQILVTDAKSVAGSIVAKIGRLEHTSGPWKHGLQYLIVMAMPPWMRNLAMRCFGWLFLHTAKSS